MTLTVITLLLTLIVLVVLLKKPVQTLWDERACPSYRIDCTKKLTIDPDAEEVRMLILGDFGSGTDGQRRVAEAAEKTCREKGCDLVLLAGDNFIQNGITCVKDEQLDTKFESIYTLDVPYFAVLGNHDMKGNWRAEIDYTKVSERWNMPAASYNINAGPVAIYAINTVCSMKTLWRLFTPTDKPWKLGLGHHPVVSSGRHGGMTWPERLVVAFSGIHFFVSGHNHVLEHSIYRGFDQVVSGAGGSPIEKTMRKQLSGTRFLYEDFGYVWARFTSKAVSFHYFDLSGKEIYAFARRK